MMKKFTWVSGLMAIYVGGEFRDRGSIPSVCQITDADLGKVGYFKPSSLNGGLLLD